MRDIRRGKSVIRNVHSTHMVAVGAYSLDGQRVQTAGERRSLRSRALACVSKVYTILCPDQSLLCRLTLAIVLLSGSVSVAFTLASGFSSDDYILLLSAQTGMQYESDKIVLNHGFDGGEPYTGFLRRPHPGWPHLFRPGSRIVQHILFRSLGERPIIHHLVSLFKRAR